MASLTDQKLLWILRTEGAQSPATLMGRLEMSQPTLFRSAKAQSENIIALGAKRNRKLAALRNVRQLGSMIPIFIISSEGEVVTLGKINSIYPSSFVFLPEASTTKPYYYQGLPFFLDDMRPQGFLGRSFSQRHLDLKLPSRILDWNNDDILEALARRGEDLPGNILVGAESFERYQLEVNKRPEAIEEKHPEASYVSYAQSAVDGSNVGSSAGGENPKFGAALLLNDGSTRKVLVKFSPVGGTFAAQRWHDLLMSEYLALEVLRENGVPAAVGRVFEGGGRTFLETVRFDRLGANGRIGILSLSALENEFTGHGSNWSVSAQLLERDKIISTHDLNIIQKLECFGRLIANSDRHSGNLSFFWEPGERIAKLAPVYDMLPMNYAPSIGGEKIERNFTLPTFDHTLLSAWKEALPLAVHYWTRVREDTRISQEFKKIAERNLEVLG